MFVTLKDTCCTMALARLSLLSLVFVSLVGSQPADDSGVLSNLATSDLSFPWSRLRLPRYLSKSFFQVYKDINKEKELKQECNWKGNIFSSLFLIFSPFCSTGTLFLFTIISSCTLTSPALVLKAQYRFRSMSETTQTGLYCTARVYKSCRPQYWTRISPISLTR